VYLRASRPELAREAAAHHIENHVEVVCLNGGRGHFVRLHLATSGTAMDDLESIALPDEFDGLHQTATPGQPIARSSLIDMH